VQKGRTKLLFKFTVTVSYVFANPGGNLFSASPCFGEIA